MPNQFICPICKDDLEASAARSYIEYYAVDPVTGEVYRTVLDRLDHSFSREFKLGCINCEGRGYEPDLSRFTVTHVGSQAFVTCPPSQEIPDAHQ